MGGFATVNAAINAAVQGKMQRLLFSKTMAGVSVALVPASLWRATPLPAVGGITTSGVANGRALSKTTAGAFVELNDAASGETGHIISMGAMTNTASATGSLIVCDRMADCNLSHAEATAAITGLDASARMASTSAPGDGGQIWCEVTTAFSAASNTITYEATDNLGNTAVAQQGMVTTASAIVERSVNSQLWQGLSSGITSVRALTKNTLTAGSATGNYNACIVRPLGYLPLIAVGQHFERDFLVELPQLRKLYDNACLFLIYVPTAAVTATIFGELRTCAA